MAEILVAPFLSIKKGETKKEMALSSFLADY